MTRNKHRRHGQIRKALRIRGMDKQPARELVGL
jgi:hypothetical protein